MDLWIRSQDKRRLIKIAQTDFTSSGYYGTMDKQYSILCQDEVWLGSYETKERAVEILDEIQNLLQPKLIWKEPKTNINYDENFIQTLANDMVIQTTQQVEYDLKQAGQIVYEMPKE